MAYLNLAEIRIFRFALMLKRPFMVGTTLSNRREGWILAIADARGKVGLGEAAPLPGLHRESLEQAARDLIAFRKKFKGKSFPDDALNGVNGLRSFLGGFRICPSVRFAIESAMIELGAQNAIVPLARFYPKKFPLTVTLNALLFGSENEVLQQAAQRVQQGYQSLKIKVGRKPLNDELALLLELTERLPKGVKLRLDANRSWTFEQALHWQRLAHAPIEYVEEPLQNPDEIPKFFKKTGIPVALDESLTQNHVHRLLAQQGIAALVLKPSLLGGWTSAIAWAEIAKRHGLNCVLSDTLSSGVGLRSTALLAAILQPQIAHGLDTYRLLNEDILATPLEITNGQLVLPSSEQIWRGLRMERLEEI